MSSISGGSVVVITPGLNQLTGDSGVATASANNINVIGGTGITTSGSGDTLTITATGSGITIDGDTGSATGSTITFNAATNAGPTVSFAASGSTVNFDVTVSGGGSGSTIIGLNSDLPASGTGNTGLGFNNFKAVSNITNSVAIGTGNLRNATGTGGVVAIGVDCLAAATTPNNSIAIGNSAMAGGIATGNNCIGIGSSAGNSLSSGADNVFISQNAGLAVTSGNQNIGIGFSTFFDPGFFSGMTTGSNNIAIGWQAGSSYNGAESSNIIIGQLLGVNGESHVTRIGNADSGTPQSACFIEGIAGVSVSSTQMVTINSSTGQLGSQVLPSSISWAVITANQTAAVNHGYICNKAGTLALALPATSSVGDIIEVTGINTALGWQITQASGQQIFFGTTQTTLGATGTLTSSATRDALRMVCITANTTWQVLSSVGNITVV